MDYFSGQSPFQAQAAAKSPPESKNRITKNTSALDGLYNRMERNISSSKLYQCNHSRDMDLVKSSCGSCTRAFQTHAGDFKSTLVQLINFNPVLGLSELVSIGSPSEPPDHILVCDHVLLNIDEPKEMPCHSVEIKWAWFLQHSWSLCHHMLKN